MAKRKAIGPKARFEVFKRDKFTCAYCGRTPPTVVLQVDHVIPVCEGGKDQRENLITSCEDCNSGKGGRSLGDCPATVVDKMKRAKEVRVQVEAYNAMLMEMRQEDDDAIDRLSDHWFSLERGGDGYSFTDAARLSIRRFLERLPEVKIINSMDLAHARLPTSVGDNGQTWKYFCGICWKRIRGDECLPEDKPSAYWTP